MENSCILHILICGGRHFNNYELLKNTALNYIYEHGFEVKNVEIISGHCPGADRLGEQFAVEEDVALKVFPAQWKRFGKAAGPIRNRTMIEYLNLFQNKAVIAFVSPNSKGTRHTVSMAKKFAIDVIEIEYFPEIEK